MYRFFTQNLHSAVATSIDPRWTNVRVGLEIATKRFVDYYQTHVTAVKGNHFLTHILAFYGANLNSSPLDQYREVDATQNQLALTLGLTSSVQPGKAHLGNFFGPGITELYLSVQKPFDVMGSYLDWRRMRPIEILSHPRSDLNPSLLDGRNLTDASGVAVITIDIPQLIIMYHAFRKWEHYETMGSEDRLSMAAFISTYVLPNMVYSYLEHALFNRLRNLQLNLPQTKSRIQNLIHLTDWNQRVDTVLDQQLKLLRDRNLRYDVMLGHMPSIAMSNQRYVQALPSMFTTRQVLGLMTLARLNVLEVLANLDHLTGGRANDDLRVRFKHHFDRVRIDRTLEGTLGPTLSKQAIEQIGQIRQLL